MPGAADEPEKISFRPLSVICRLEISPSRPDPSAALSAIAFRVLRGSGAFSTSEACEKEWGPLRRLPPPGVLSENEGDGELGGRVMELIKLGPLSIG